MFFLRKCVCIIFKIISKNLPVLVTIRLEGCTTEALSSRLDKVKGVFIMVAMLL